MNALMKFMGIPVSRSAHVPPDKVYLLPDGIVIGMQVKHSDLEALAHAEHTAAGIEFRDRLFGDTLLVPELSRRREVDDSIPPVPERKVLVRR